MSLIKAKRFMVHEDARGTLSVYEAAHDIGFDIKRVYCLTRATHGSSRGYHAHRQLKQVVVCVNGSCRIVLDDGYHREEEVLDNPGIGLAIDGIVWRELHDFSPECVVVVFASEPHDEADYIRDYEVFLKEVQGG